MNERLPFELGWSTKDFVISVEDIMKVSDMVGEATNLLTDDAASEKVVRHPDLHSGIGLQL